MSADTQRAWYQEQAEAEGVKAIHWMLHRELGYRNPRRVYPHARLAAHFGRLALGEEEQPIADAYRDWLLTPVIAVDDGYRGSCRCPSCEFRREYGGFSK